MDKVRLIVKVLLPMPLAFCAPVHAIVSLFEVLQGLLQLSDFGYRLI